MKLHTLLGLCIVGLVTLAGCKPAANNGGTGTGTDSGPAASGDNSGGVGGKGGRQTFSLAWSEYPSWSVFGVAHEMGLLDAAEGKLGEFEEKYNVDIVLKELDYGSCLNAFASGECDAVCITNMDALIVSPNRDGVAVLPTSTSNGADACIVVGINTLDELKQHTTWGLEDSVSEYCFVRCIEEIEKTEKKGYNAADFKFTNQEPAAAAVAMKQKQETHQSIMVWNPFVLQSLRDRPDAKVLFDSSKIPGEIVDMVVVGKDVLEKPGARRFVRAILSTFYRMNEELAKPDTGDETLVALGAKFSSLGLEDMKTVVQQTQFYKTPDEGLALLNGDPFKQTMETVKKFCVDQGLVTDPQIGFTGDTGVKLLFDDSYLADWKQEAGQ